RLAGFAVEDVKEALLGRLRDYFHGAPVDADIRQDRRAGDIHVPYTVMDQLVVPLALAGLQVHGDEALAEESVAGTIASVVIAGWQLYGQIDKPQVFVNGDLCPYARVARVGQGVLTPRVGSIFTGEGDGVKNPEPLAGSHIESAH